MILGGLGVVMASLPLTGLASSPPGKAPAAPAVVTLTPAASSARLRDTTLTLQDVLRMVDAHAPKMIGNDLQRRQAEARRLERAGAFDPSLNGGAEFLRYNSSSDPGKAQEAFVSSLSYDQLLRSGVRLQAGGALNAGDIKTPLSVTGEGGEYYAGLRVPLLRGFLVNERAIAERQAILGIPFADAEFIQDRFALLMDAASAYNSWAAAHQRLGVARQLLSIARQRAHMVADRVKAGDLPAIDSVEARQEVARRQGALYQAQRSFELNTFKLGRYLWLPSGQAAPLPQAKQAPVSLPRPQRVSSQDEWQGKAAAWVLRPELRNLAFQQRIVELDLALARNQRLPQVDLIATPGIETGKNAIGAVLRAGVSISVPLRTRTAQGKMQQAQLKLDKLVQDIRQTRQDIRLQIEDVLSALEAVWLRYEAAEEEWQLAQQLEQGERTRFDLGDSTLFLVNQRERATAEAAVRLIDLRAEYQLGRASFLAVTGQL
jgi:outer membrane protein TolC